MEKKSKKVGLMIGVVVLCMLLLYWLFISTTLNEEEELGSIPAPTEQGY